MKALYLLLVVMLFMPLVNASAGVVSSNLPLAKHIRAIHFVLRAVPYESGIRIVDMASQAGMNTIVVQITDGVRLEHAPWSTRKDAWRKDELKQWATYAKSKGISIVPELKLLTHQENFFQDHFPQLMYNAVSYNPSKKVYDKVFPLLDEIIDLINPPAIHIGHDEVVGWNARHVKKKLKTGEKMLPAHLFVQDVLTLHAYLKGKGIQTWMWGDMLISPDEFPEMPARPLHGAKDDYGKNVRDQLPKDIAICDWHYFDNQKQFPTLKIMQQEGFRVIGAAWKKEKTIKNFSHYAAEQDAYGMMATTWWHVQKKEWDVVDRIISVSGKTFLKDFPDEK